MLRACAVTILDVEVLVSSAVGVVTFVLRSASGSIASAKKKRCSECCESRGRMKSKSPCRHNDSISEDPRMMCNKQQTTRMVFGGNREGG